MFVAGPIYDKEGKLVGMGVFRFNPHHEFYKLLPQQKPRLIAFDEKGLVLNDFGETELLRRHGLLPGMEPGESGILRLRLRDPGGDLRTGFQPGTTPEQWAPTVMSHRASEAPLGIQTDSYRDVLGRPVRGTWTWLPEWEMGLGAEEEQDQILAPAKPVHVMFLVILGIPVLYTTALLLGARPLRSWFGARPGSTFGPYVLERSIGKGGMAEVFLARHDILKRPTAVKILSNSDPDAATVARFEREARLACRLAHPNTIQIFDYGETPEGKLYYAMEYVRGLNLAQLLSLEPRTPVARAIYMLRQIAGSLEEAHSLGLVHRDLKPSNIMVCEKGGLFGIVKVLDFGIATSCSAASDDFTKSVELMGTPAYMAPERIRSPQHQDPRSDIYSFGAVAFHLLTGRNLFEGPGPTELIYQVMSADRPSPSQLRGEPLPPVLEKLVVDCLAINPAARPGDFGKILDILDQVKISEPWTREKSREWWEANRQRLAAFL
jgi:tRNA A-37 threonylcarbamoyl transferase component Bud32